MMRVFLVLAGLNGAMGVAAGAYAAHALSDAGPQAVRWMELASTYQLLHALALVAVVAVLPHLADRPMPRALALVAGGLFVAGMVLFCGALYALALNVGLVRNMAPTGGMAFILGWLALASAGALVRRPTRQR